MDTTQTDKPTTLPPSKTVEQWRDEKKLAFRTLDGKVNPDAWKFAAAKGLHGWVDGFEITEADFDAAIEAGMNVQHGTGE